MDPAVVELKSGPAKGSANPRTEIQACRFCVHQPTGRSHVEPDDKVAVLGLQCPCWVKRKIGLS